MFSMCTVAMTDINRLGEYWKSFVHIYSSYEDFMDQSDEGNNKFHSDANIIAALKYYGIFDTLHDTLRNVLPMNGSNTIKETPAQEAIDCEVRGVLIYNSIISAWDSIPETTQFEIMMITGHDIRPHFEGILKQFKYTMDTVWQAKKEFEENALPQYNS